MVFDDHGAVDVLQFLVVVAVVLNPAGDGVGQAVHFQVDAVFVFQAVFQNFELELPDGTDDVAFHGAQVFINLDGPFLGQLGHALEELFTLHRVFGADAGEEFRREGREVLEGDFFLARIEGVADAHGAVIEDADDVSRVSIFDDGPFRGQELLGLHEAQGLARLAVGDGHAFFEFARADAHEDDAVVMLGVHVGLDLEDERRELVRCRFDDAFQTFARLRLRCHTQKFFQERLDAEVGHGRTEEHRRQFAALDLFHVEFVACFVEELDVVDETLVDVFVKEFLENRVVGRAFGRCQFALAVGRVFFKEFDRRRSPVVDALVVSVQADRPVHGVGVDAKDVFDFIHEVEGVAAEVVDFIDEGEDGNAPFFTDAEKFLCLGFDAFGDVDEHDGAVGSHEGPVRIFTEVLMARRVEDIDVMAFVVELKDRTGDRDTTLFFDFHPVRNGVLRRLSGFDGTGQVDSTSVEQ